MGIINYYNCWFLIILMDIGIGKTCYGSVAFLCRCDSAFLSGATLMLLTCIVWLKLVSYAHTTYDMRALTLSNEKAAKAVVSISKNIFKEVMLYISCDG